MNSSPIAAQRARLVSHSSTPGGEAIRGVEISVSRGKDGTLQLVYSLFADLAHVRVPARRAPQRADSLWKHTCFEAFLALSGSSYLELNFAPSGEWAAYRFSGYRQGMEPLDLAAAPLIDARSSKDGLEVSVTVTVPPGARTRVALASVIEETNGRISYWALRHAAGKPDFHHPEAFALEL